MEGDERHGLPRGEAERRQRRQRDVEVFVRLTVDDEADPERADEHAAGLHLAGTPHRVELLQRCARRLEELGRRLSGAIDAAGDEEEHRRRLGARLPGCTRDCP